jgi:excisionase family DNA binding protein
MVLNNFNKENFDQMPCTLNVEEIATILKISKGKAYELVRQGSFPKIKIGKRIIIPFNKFITWLDKQSDIE